MRMVFEAPALASALEPGQFMNLEVPGDASHILRIPLSFAAADAEQGSVELLYAVVGEGTARLASMAQGESLPIVGPLGNGWQPPAEEGSCLLVAGGIGLPPIVAAATMLDQLGLGFDVVVAARDSAHLIDSGLDALGSLEHLGRIVVTTDDGSAGLRGFATDGMAELMGARAYAQAYACGPTPMLKAISATCAEADMSCQLSLEAMMGCGFGACSCCNVALAGGGYALCCSDGPVFDAREVVL